MLLQSPYLRRATYNLTFRISQNVYSSSFPFRITTSRQQPHQRKLSPVTVMTSPYSSIATPARCYADFCLVPVGTANASVAEEVAAVQRLLQASGLKYTMHSAGTTVEGSWDDVMRIIGQAHSLVHQTGVLRVQTSMRVGTRTDKSQTAEEKVKRVQDVLAQDDPKA